MNINVCQCDAVCHGSCHGNGQGNGDCLCARPHNADDKPKSKQKVAKKRYAVVQIADRVVQSVKTCNSKKGAIGLTIHLALQQSDESREDIEKEVNETFCWKSDKSGETQVAIMEAEEGE